MLVLHDFLEFPDAARPNTIKIYLVFQGFIPDIINLALQGLLVAIDLDILWRHFAQLSG